MKVPVVKHEQWAVTAEPVPVLTIDWHGNITLITEQGARLADHLDPPPIVGRDYDVTALMP